MPFPQQNPRPFTKADIESLNSGQMGCYGIYRAGVWIYVGKGDIRERLLSHLNGNNPCLTRQMPTHWIGVVTQDYDNEEKRLIVELNPVCNKKVG